VVVSSVGCTGPEGSGWGIGGGGGAECFDERRQGVRAPRNRRHRGQRPPGKGFRLWRQKPPPAATVDGERLTPQKWDPGVTTATAEKMEWEGGSRRIRGRAEG